MNKKITAVLLLIIAVAFTVYGAYRGEASVVLKKAINVCLECIGIG
jgi:hypothetical protein